LGHRQSRRRRKDEIVSSVRVVIASWDRTCYAFKGGRITLRRESVADWIEEALFEKKKIGSHVSKRGHYRKGEHNKVVLLLTWWLCRKRATEENGTVLAKGCHESGPRKREIK